MTTTRDFWQIDGAWLATARRGRESAPDRKKASRRERPDERVAVPAHVGAESPGRPSPLIFLE